MSIISANTIQAAAWHRWCATAPILPKMFRLRTTLPWLGGLDSGRFYQTMVVFPGSMWIWGYDGICVRIIFYILFSFCFQGLSNPLVSFSCCHLNPIVFSCFFLKSLGRSHVESFNESTQRDGYGGPVAIDKLPVKSDSIASVKIIK